MNTAIVVCAHQARPEAGVGGALCVRVRISHEPL